MSSSYTILCLYRAGHARLLCCCRVTLNNTCIEAHCTFPCAFAYGCSSMVVAVWLWQLQSQGDLPRSCPCAGRPLRECGRRCQTRRCQARRLMRIYRIPKRRRPHVRLAPCDQRQIPTCNVQRSTRRKRANAYNVRRYCIKRETCEEVSSALGDRGMQADAYHAGLSTRVREQVQSEWLASDSGIVVSTTVRSAVRAARRCNPACLPVCPAQNIVERCSRNRRAQPRGCVCARAGVNARVYACVRFVGWWAGGRARRRVAVHWNGRAACITLNE